MSLLFNGRRQPSRGGTSRISREAYVRIRERLGVKSPPGRRGRSTHAIGALGLSLVPLYSCRSLLQRRDFPPSATCCREQLQQFGGITGRAVKRGGGLS